MERRVWGILIGIFFVFSASFFVTGHKPEKPIPREINEQPFKDGAEVPRPEPPRNTQSEPVQAAIAKTPRQVTLGLVPSNAMKSRSRQLSIWAGNSEQSIQSSGVQYKVLDEVRAVSEKNFRPADGTIVERRGGFVLFEKGDAPPVGSKFVVYNQVTKSLGVITGALSVSFKSFSVSPSVASQYRLKPIQEFEHLRVAFFQSEREELSEITELYDQLKSDPRVESVDLQIIDRSASPR